MKNIKILYFLLSSFIFLNLSFEAIAQEENTDSLSKTNDTITTKYFYEKEIKYNLSASYTLVDTNIAGFQVFNPLLSKFPFIRVNGNIGQAFQNLVFDVKTLQTYNNIHLSLDNYIVTNDQIKYYETKQAFSEIEYVNGAKKENFFHILHSQNIRKNFNISLQFDVINSLGSYVRSLSNHRYFLVSSNYLSKNKRYGFLTHIIYNKIHNQEWGGLSDIVNAQDNLQQNKSLDARLTSTDNSLVVRRIYLNQFVNLGKIVEFQVNDSTKKKEFVASNRLSHSCSFQDKGYLFTDEGYDMFQYQNAFFLENLTKDSSHYEKLENEIKWLYTGELAKNTLLKNIVSGFSIIHNFNRVVQHNNDTIHAANNDTTFHNLMASLYLGSNEKKTLQWNINANYTIWGYNKGNYEAKAEARKYLGDRKNEFYFGLRLLFFEKNRDYLTNHFKSNHFIWNRNFNSFQVAQYGVDFGLKKFKVIIDYTHLRKYLFWTATGVPVQSAKSFDIYSISILKNFNFKFAHLDNYLVFQQATKPEIYDIPKFAARNSIYFNFHLFKKVLLVSAGMDVLFSTAYNALEYLPALSVFYPVNTQKIEAYPYVDIFINAKLKRAKFFAKLEHTNAKLLGYGYFATPSQPMAARTVKFGISWDMLY